jgi:hypothetical protein
VPIGRGELADLQEAVSVNNMTLLAAEPEPEPGAATAGSQSQGTGLGKGDNNGSVQQPVAELGRSQGESSVAERSSSAVCLVLGSEGQGLSPEVQAVCTPVAIPMQGGMESLNVGVAGGILMFMLSQGLPQLVGRLGSLTGSATTRE